MKKIVNIIIKGVKLGTTEYIALAGVAATALGAFATWFVMQRQFGSKKLAYRFDVEPIVKSTEPNLARDLQIHFKGELLPNPTLLSVEITNIGLSAIENAQIVIQLPGATYLIPGYFNDIPAGYSSLWSITRTEPEECTLTFVHINPKQVAKVRLIMDDLPKADPLISCPMPNVQLVKASNPKLDLVAELVVGAALTKLLR